MTLEDAWNKFANGSRTVRLASDHERGIIKSCFYSGALASAAIITDTQHSSTPIDEQTRNALNALMAEIKQYIATG